MPDSKKKNKENLYPHIGKFSLIENWDEERSKKKSAVRQGMVVEQTMLLVEDLRRARLAKNIDLKLTTNMQWEVQSNMNKVNDLELLQRLQRQMEQILRLTPNAIIKQPEIYTLHKSVIAQIQLLSEPDLDEKQESRIKKR